MLVEKVPWAVHDGGIYTIHVQSTGLRFATGGADCQVKVWSLTPVLDVKQEKAGPLVLATLGDHSSPVNTVRFSNNGKYLASGSDDRMICVYEHRPGVGNTALGGGGPSVENWRTRQVLRGHSNNVVDLGWSPDDSMLASASIDNAVCIWDPQTGQRLKVLDYHTSFVKGLAWDPVGTYLATQSEDKSVVIWRCDDWSVVAVVRSPYAKMVTATFSTRMSWSPDGSFLATGNSYQGSSHAAVVLQREKWNEDKQHLLISGHQGCVVSTAFNPRMFHQPKKGGAPEETEEKLGMVFALGSQDKRISVWSSTHHAALVVGKRFFKNQVTDLCWTPDGFTLLAASSDGTVGCFQFSVSELGKSHTQEEMDEVYRQLYGSVRGAVGKQLFAESADLLALEAAAALGSPDQLAGDLLPPLPAPSPGATAGRQQAATAAAAGGQQQQQQLERALQPSAKQNLDALNARFSGRLGGGGGGEVQLGFDAPPQGGAAAAAAAAGRKRVAPEPVGQAPSLPSSADLMPPPPPRPSGGQQPEAKRKRVEPTPTAAAAAPATGSGRVTPAGPAAAAGAAAGTVAAPGAMAPVAVLPHIMLRSAELPAEVVADLGQPPRLFQDPFTAAAEAAPRRQLRIVNKERSDGRLQAEVVCEEGVGRGMVVQWSDMLHGAAVAACGTHNFAAVALADGQLLLYSRAGRHMVAPLKLGAGIAKLACDSAWRLLAVTTSGTVRLFDAEALRSLLTASLAPLLEDGCTVLDARLSRMGAPLISLSNNRAYVWSAEMEGWACVADESFAASQFLSLLDLPGRGEISALQAQVLRATIPSASLPAYLLNQAPQQQVASRAHLEASLSTALSLQSPQEYRRWLLAYARFLTQHADAGRLGEVCGELLGTGQRGVDAAAVAAQLGGGGDADMVDAGAAGGEPGAAAAVAAAGEGGAEQQEHEQAVWEPTVLGLEKHALLREVLKVMSLNRGVQRTTQTYLDALADIERAAAARAARRAAEAAAAGGGGAVPDAPAA